ncbi:MAG: STAS domain-containing protein [Betaproteobacteria bacterium]
MIAFANGRYSVQGAVTLDTAPALLEDAKKQFEGSEILVDFSGVTQADSSAVALMLEWTRDAAAQGRRIRFANFSENLKTLIALYEVEQFLPAA